MASSLQDKVFVVTGGASGIGLATANALIEQGAMVGLCDVNEEGLDKFKADLKTSDHDRLITSTLDI